MKNKNLLILVSLSLVVGIGYLALKSTGLQPDSPQGNAIGDMNARFLRPMEMQDLAGQSSFIVSGRLAQSEVIETDKGYWTVAEIEVRESLKGEPGERIEVRWPGGRIGDIEMVVPGTPKLMEGDEVLTFVRENGMVTGMAQGAFRIRDDGLLERDLSGIHFQEQERSVQDLVDPDELREAVY